jgi:DNA-binding response OmpR family regulator
VETVLVVEDDADLRRMFRMALGFAGYRVIEAADGLNALRLLDVELPKAVVLDLGLPLVSGQTVRAEIAAHAHTRDIPVVIVTGQAGNHNQLDAACVLRKPLSPDRLVQTVRSCIASGGLSSSC